MKRVCFDVRMIHSSGIGTYIKKLLFLLSKRVDFVLLRDPKTADKEPFIKEFAGVDCASSIYSLKEQIDFSFKIPSCDIFWSPHFVVPCLPIRAKKRLVTIHDVYHLAFLPTLSFSKKAYAKWMYRQAIEKSDHIITVSHFSLAEMKRFFDVDEKKVSVIHNGVDFEKKMLVHNVDESIKDLGSFLLFVGIGKPHKNLQRLLEAFSLLKENIKLVVVGKRKGFLSEDECVEKHKNVIVLDHVPEETLSWLYQNAKAFIFPSLYEGFGFPPLEAMSYGCPVLCSNQASLPEVCKDAALFMNPYDIRDMARQLKTILDDEALREDLIKKGFERVKTFSLEKMAMKHLEVIENL